MIPTDAGRARSGGSRQGVRRGRRAVPGQPLDGTTFRLLSAFAVLSGVADVVLAVHLRIVDDGQETARRTVLESFGARGLLAALVPLLAAAVVIPLCVVARGRNSRNARATARIVATAVLAIAVVATVTIVVGIIAVPTAATLTGIAWSRTTWPVGPDERSAQPTR